MRKKENALRKAIPFVFFLRLLRLFAATDFSAA
jgi:hypothetical protein